MEKRLQNRLSGCIRQVVSTLELRAENDQELLQRFQGQRDEAAFAAVVRRHGPMVLRVALRTLQNEHDAEDVFQATFLVLSQKAHTLRRQQSLGSWLYGIAYRLALKVKATAGERRNRERRVAATPAATPLAQITVQEAQTILDEELNRLPKKFREPVVLCCLEGLARDEAAQQIGCPASVLKSRLEQARERLRQRLIARGLTLPCGLGAFLLLEGAATATVSPALIGSTTKAAITMAAGKATRTVVTAKVAALTEGVLRTMLLTKITIATVALVVGMMALGGGTLTYRTLAAEGASALHQAEAQLGPADKSPAAAATDEKKGEAPQKQEKEGFTAWGKEVGGLQAGLGYPSGEKRAYSHGETVKLVVRVRNVGKEAVPFECVYAFLVENPPAVTDADGKPIPLPRFIALGAHGPTRVDLAPGKEIEIHELKLELRPASESGNKKYSTLYGTGKFSIQYDRVVGKSSAGTEPDPTLSKLATGKLELEIKSEVKPPQQQEQKQENEGFTAWGKEVGGLQAGLGYHPGQKRAYSHGEMVKLVVRVRNVGKDEVKFQYLREFFLETPPAVTDGKGKPVPQLRYEVSGQVHLAVEVSLAPGKEIELYEWTPELKPGNKVVPDTLWASGKVSIQYERIFGNTGAGQIKPDPTLSKLATGKLELEIKSEPPPAAPEKKEPPKQEKDALTAWGKEVGGLQAGLGFHPGQKRAYSPGETVKLVVRVRNLGKEEIKFQYLKEFFIEKPPTVTDGNGKPVALREVLASGEGHVAVKVNLAPGKEIELYELKLEPRSATQGAKEGEWTLHGTGTFQIQYEQVIGVSSVGQLILDRNLKTLATGKLELEIKTDPPPAAEMRSGASQEGEPKPVLRDFTVTGTVTDAQDKPLDGVVVNIFRKAYAKDAKQPRIEDFGMTKTNSSGSFEIMTLYAVWETEARSGFLLKFSAPGFAPKSLSVDKTFDPKKKIKIILEKEQEKEGFTAWGKEVGGLQAGLGYHPGEKRVYSHGETVKLVVRVRNVGKEAVKFSYLMPYIEHEPIVTDGESKRVPQPTRLYEIGARFPGQVELAPGKEIELHELKRELKPASESGNTRTRSEGRPHALYGTGKVSVHYEQVLGDPVMGYPGWKLDPNLSKLATGELELEIKTETPAGWGGGGGKDYELRVDRTMKLGGKASASIKSITMEPTWYGAFTQAFQADNYRGQRLRMTAYVKSKDVEDSAGLWMRIESFDGKGNYSLSSDYMGDRPIKGTNDWKQYEVVLDVPNEGSAAIYFGMLLAGKGQVWVDDFKLEAVEKTVKTTGRVREPVKSKDGLSKGLPKEPKNLDFDQ